jgi:hypothetical protein
MTINAQSGVGRIRLFEDFFNVLDQTDISANTATPDMAPIGPFSVFGEGSIEIDSGILAQHALSGVGRLATTDVDDDGTMVGTYNCFDVGLMGPIILEARIQMPDLDTKRVFFGLTDATGGDEKKDLSIEDDIIASTTLTFTPVASDYVGFLFSSEMTDVDVWHYVYRGGSSAMTSGAVSASYDFPGYEAVAGEWQVLRLEIDSNGTARWYIDGTLLKTQTGACSTSVDMGVVLGVEVVSGTSNEYLDVDYLLVEANRDWNA